MRIRPAIRVAILTSLALGGAAGCDGDEFELTPLYNHANGRVVIELGTELADGEQLFVRARRGNFGVLDCAKLVTEVEPIERCSGHNGTYGVKRQFRDTSMKIGKPVFNKVAQAGADHYASDCPMAGHQIESGLENPKPPTHPLTLLRIAYGI